MYLKFHHICLYTYTLYEYYRTKISVLDDKQTSFDFNIHYWDFWGKLCTVFSKVKVLVRRCPTPNRIFEESCQNKVSYFISSFIQSFMSIDLLLTLDLLNGISVMTITACVYIVRQRYFTFLNAIRHAGNTNSGHIHYRYDLHLHYTSDYLPCTNINNQ